MIILLQEINKKAKLIFCERTADYGIKVLVQCNPQQ